MNLTIDNLKIIRLALSSYQLSTDVLNAIAVVDDELAKHNIKVHYQSLPKRKYQRQKEGKYVFVNIN